MLAARSLVCPERDGAAGGEGGQDGVLDGAGVEEDEPAAEGGDVARLAGGEGGAQAAAVNLVGW